MRRKLVTKILVIYVVNADNLFFAEEEFGIETKIIVADFSKGRSVFDHIAQELKNVDVGILGMQKYHLHSSVPSHNFLAIQMWLYLKGISVLCNIFK